MPEEDHSVEIGRMDGGISPIITGDRNTATITITNYYYHENITGVPVKSIDAMYSSFYIIASEFTETRFLEVWINPKKNKVSYEFHKPTLKLILN